MSTVWQKSRATGDRLLLLLAIADYANDDGVAWPAVESLASKARCSERHAQRLLKELVESKELIVERGGGRRRCNRYTVTLCQGDTITPTSCQGDISSERVTFETEKGDMDVTRSVMIRHLYPSEKERKAPGGASEPEAGNEAPALPRPAGFTGGPGSREDSQAQWAALNGRLQKALGRQSDGDLGERGRLVLKKIRAALEELQKKQARGDFSLLDLTQFEL